VIIIDNLNSSNIEHIIYDDDKLTVRFKGSNTLYTYNNVLPETFNDLLNAKENGESIGKFINTRIKNNNEYVKLERNDNILKEMYFKVMLFNEAVNDALFLSYKMHDITDWYDIISHIDKNYDRIVKVESSQPETWCPNILYCDYLKSKDSKNLVENWKIDEYLNSLEN